MKYKHLWIYRQGQPGKKVFVEDIKDLVPEFPTFKRKAMETRAQAAERQRAENTKIGQSVHQFMELTLCKAYLKEGSIDERRLLIGNELRTVADNLLAKLHIHHMHPHITVRTMTDIIEVSLSYRTVGTGSPHVISISPLSPSEQ